MHFGNILWEFVEIILLYHSLHIRMMALNDSQFDWKRYMTEKSRQIPVIFLWFSSFVRNLWGRLRGRLDFQLAWAYFGCMENTLVFHVFIHLTRQMAILKINATQCSRQSGWCVCYYIWWSVSISKRINALYHLILWLSLTTTILVTDDYHTHRIITLVW